MKSRKGFTLAELLVVVAILAVLVAIAVPVFLASLDRARLTVDAATERQALDAAAIEYMAFQERLGEMTDHIVDEGKRKEGWYFFYDPAGGLIHANDYTGTEPELEPYKIGQWGDHKGKFLMVLIKPDGTPLFRWGHEAPSGASLATNWGFGPAPSIAELQKRRA